MSQEVNQLNSSQKDNCPDFPSANSRSQSFFKHFREQHPQPYYHFTNLPDSERLTYEMLSTSNYKEVPKMFKEEDNPFVIDEYKSEEKFVEYTSYLLNYNRFSPKYGACDWLFKLKETGEYIGIVNVYDLNRERFNDHHLKCTIGFNVKAEFRKLKYTTEAVQQLLAYIPKQFSRNKIVAYTQKDNIPSISFLKKLGFIDKTEEYTYEDRYSFFELMLTGS
jgi:RimJ/RimL family protein N-acetyltransferase